MLSKLFDADKDGKQNSVEKQNALDAINKGFENRFIWNIDKGGSERQIRVLQKRGVFVEAEDFQPVGKTYPKLELSNNTPQISTKETLEQSRKESLQEKLRQTKNQWDKYNPHSIKQEFIFSEYLVDKPAHTTVSQIKEDKLKEVRELHGLTTTPASTNAQQSNGLSYKENPRFKTQTEMNNLKKDENVLYLSSSKNLVARHSATK